jgi:hypothetical protein
LPIETAPGAQLQVDFGEKRVTVAGSEVTVFLLVAVLSYSRRVFVKAFLHERQDDWCEGIAAAFAHFGGVPLTVLGDNARALVLGRDRATATVTFHPSYLAFCRDWDVQPRACAPYRARTKGKVQSGVKYVKRNALAGRPFASFAALEQHLAAWDVTRFRGPGQVTSYLGLVPREYSSGEQQRRGSIMRAADPRVQWLLVQAAWRIWRSTHPGTQALREWARAIARRRGTRVAIVAWARRLARILFAMWRDQTDFEPKRIRTTHASTAVAAPVHATHSGTFQPSRQVWRSERDKRPWPHVRAVPQRRPPPIASYCAPATVVALG